MGQWSYLFLQRSTYSFAEKPSFSLKNMDELVLVLIDLPPRGGIDWELLKRLGIPAVSSKLKQFLSTLGIFYD